MQDILKIFGVAILCSAVMLVLRSVSGSFSDVARICGGVLVCGLVIAFSRPLVDFAFEIVEGSQVNEYLSVMLKALGVGFLTHICSSVCRDCGEGTLAAYTELAGKLELLILSLPLISEVLEIAEGLVEMI